MRQLTRHTKRVGHNPNFDFMFFHAPGTQLTRHTTHGHKMKIDIFSRAGHPTHATHQIVRFDAKFDFMFSHAPHTQLTRHTNHAGGHPTHATHYTRTQNESHQDLH